MKHIHQNIPIDKEIIKIPFWVIPFIIILTFLVYIPSLKAGFVNWDDGDYVVDNPLLKDFSNLKLLLTKPVQGNYHPLTMLSLAFNYSISGLNSWSYHLLNLLLHLLNSFLVFRLAMLLSGKNITIAFTTAILFGIHPMHVESVAWISERKDVLYSLFYLTGLIIYIKYLDTGSRKQYFFTILLLALSLLSKPAAVIFPLTLFCIDILRKRKLDFKLFLEKVPFFILAIIDGLVTYHFQKATGSTGSGSLELGSRIIISSYGIMMYVLKMIAPFNLSSFYPLRASLTIEYFLAPLFFMALLVMVFYSWKRNRVIAFGILFYLVNLLLVLQLVQFGSAVIAERYTYIPYIGLFYIAAWLIDRYTKGNIYKANYIIIPLALALSALTYRQSSVWLSGATLWDHTIKTQPSARAYKKRAFLFGEEKNYDKAIEYYSKSIKINVDDYKTYTDRGEMYLCQNRFDLAHADFKKALVIKSNYHRAIHDLGSLFGLRGKYDTAQQFLNWALAVKPDYVPSYRERGLTYIKMKRYEEAIKDFEKVLQLNHESHRADDPEVYNIIGTCYYSMGKYERALTAINKALVLKPNSQFFLNRSYIYNALNNTELAKKDALTAKQRGIKIENRYAKSLGIQ